MPSSNTTVRTPPGSARDRAPVPLRDATSPFGAVGCAGATITVRPATDLLASFLGGFVAAEGCFTGNGSRRFRFNVGLGATDADMCDVFAATLAVGHIVRSQRRKAHYDDEVQFTAQSVRELVEVVVPFMDAHLPPSYKRTQYLEWRARLLEHWEHSARRRATCLVDGCAAPAKAYGLCRPHLWRERRQ